MKNLKYEDKKILVISIVMIIFLGFFSVRNFRNMRDIEKPLVDQEDRKIENIIFPDMDIGSLDDLKSLDIEELLKEHNIGGIGDLLDVPDEIIYSPYTVSDILTFEYPSHWIRQEIETDERDQGKIKALFVAHSIRLGSPTVLVFLRIEGDSIKSGLEKIKEVFKIEGIEKEIIRKEEKENGIYFEARYRYEDGQVTISRERMFSVDGKYYLLSVIAFENNLEDYLEKMEHIITSIQINR